MSYRIEVTDMFGGESNYSWVRRTTTDKPTHRGRVREAKAFAGWTGLRCDVDNGGDMVTIRPRGICQIAFITWGD